jgi:hypothetical protein
MPVVSSTAAHFRRGVPTHVDARSDTSRAFFPIFEAKTPNPRPVGDPIGSTPDERRTLDPRRWIYGRPGVGRGDPGAQSAAPARRIALHGGARGSGTPRTAVRLHGGDPRRRWPPNPPSRFTRAARRANCKHRYFIGNAPPWRVHESGPSGVGARACKPHYVSLAKRNDFAPLGENPRFSQ